MKMAEERGSFNEEEDYCNGCLVNEPNLCQKNDPTNCEVYNANKNIQEGIKYINKMNKEKLKVFSESYLNGIKQMHTLAEKILEENK